MAGRNDFDYKSTGTYKRADPRERKLLEAWKRDQEMCDTQMTLLLSLEDLRQTPKEEKKKGNKTAETMLVLSMFFFLFAVSMGGKSLLLVSSVIVIINTAIYLSGLTNPYSIRLRQVKKELSQFPKVKPFEEWKAEQPAGTEAE